jgi:hypothetical protein
MRLPLYYPTIDGGWREFWFGTSASDGNPRERDVLNSLLINNLELINNQFKGQRVRDSTHRKGVE